MDKSVKQEATQDRVEMTARRMGKQGSIAAALKEATQERKEEV